MWEGDGDKTRSQTEYPWAQFTVILDWKLLRQLLRLGEIKMVISVSV